jgi:hypothetical protein
VASPWGVAVPAVGICSCEWRLPTFVVSCGFPSNLVANSSFATAHTANIQGLPQYFSIEYPRRSGESTRGGSFLGDRDDMDAVFGESGLRL